MDPKNIKAIMEWPNLGNVDEVKSFMGLEGCYRRFIRNFSNFGYPVTSLQRKWNNFEWTEESAVSFEQLKDFLTNDLVLKIADPNREFVVCIDVCKEGLGGVLM